MGSELTRTFDLLAKAVDVLSLKFNPDQPRAPAGSPEGGQFGSGGGGDISGEGKAYSKMGGEELHTEMMKLVRGDEERKKKDKTERARLDGIFQERTREYDKAKAPEELKRGEIEEARKNWLSSIGSEAKARGVTEAESSLAYDRLKELSKPADPVAAAVARKIYEEAGKALVDFNEKSREGAVASKGALELIRLDPADRSQLVPDTSSVGGAGNSVQKGVTIFQSIVHKDAIGLSARVEFVEDRGCNRAFYSGWGKVNLASEGGGGKRSVLHELGHWLDDTNKEVGKSSRAFLKEHTKAEVFVKPKPLGKGYGADEVYRPRTDGTKWINNYMGKVYRGGGPSGNEITSMGLEMYATKPLELAKKDPVLFKHIADICRGKYKNR